MADALPGPNTAWDGTPGKASTTFLLIETRHLAKTKKIGDQFSHTQKDWLAPSLLSKRPADPITFPEWRLFFLP